MRSHTQAFKNEIKQYGRQLSSIMYTGSILIQHLDNTYNNSLYRDEINSIQYYYDCELFKTCMQTLVIDSKVEIPIGTAIDCRLGVKVNNANENLIFGVYYVNKVEQQKDKKSWLVTCYDKMIETMKDYESFYNATTDTTFTTDKNYYYYDNDKQRYKRYTGARTGNPTTLGLYQSAFPMTIRDYILAICNRLNISTMNISQETLGNFLKQVTSEHYIDVDGNKMGYTYRDVLDEIAKSLGEFLYISNNNLTHKSCISTDDTINEDYFNDKNVNIGKKIGPYNVVVLSRANDSDNIHYPAILPSNPIEFKITNNLILEQDNRQDFIQTIYNRITGLEFYTNDFATNGIMYYELGDKYNVSIDGVTYPCLMLSDNIKITTGLKENIHTNEPQQSVTDYKYSSSTDKTEIASRNAKILVDKANASIEQIVEAVGDNGEVTSASIVQSINDSGSQIQLNANKIYINGVTFDNQQKMTMTDGNIDIIDNGTDLIENSHITIQSINLDKLSWLTSSVIKFQEQLSGGSQDTRLSSSGFSYSYQNTNNTERSSSSLGGDILNLSYYNQSDNQDCSLQLMSNAISMSYFTESGGVTTTHNVFNVDSNGDTTINGKLIIQKDGEHNKGLYDNAGNPIIRDWQNNNVSFDATGGNLYLGYRNTTGINILDGKFTIASNGDLYNKTFDLFNDTSGSDWKTMLKNKLDYCINNINTTKNYTQTFINGGWQNVMFGFGMFSKINTTYQLVWFANEAIYYCMKSGTTYSYKFQKFGDNYSESESIIGTWLGKPLYRKVVKYNNTSTIGSSSSVTNISIPHGISNIGQPVKCSVAKNTGHFLSNMGGTNVSYGTCVTQVDTTNINLRIINDTWGASTWYFILEYTKSTD